MEGDGSCRRFVDKQRRTEFERRISKTARSGDVFEILRSKSVVDRPPTPGKPPSYTWYPIGEPGPSGMPRAYQIMKKMNQPTSMDTAYGSASDIRVPTPAFL